jgi:hypothetical protein
MRTSSIDCGGEPWRTHSCGDALSHFSTPAAYRRDVRVTAVSKEDVSLYRCKTYPSACGGCSIFEEGDFILIRKLPGLKKGY